MDHAGSVFRNGMDFFLLIMNIIHAAGLIDGVGYTNSVEAVEKYLGLGEVFIELDCISLKDTWAMAHDGVEEKLYGIQGKFSGMAIEDFEQLKISKRWTPLNFSRLEKISARYPKARFIIDVKAEGERYADFCRWLKKNCSPALISRLVPQVYCMQDREILRKAGVRRYLVALWKYFDNSPFSKDSINLIRGCSSEELFGVSLRWSNPQNEEKNILSPEFGRLVDLVGVSRIYLHGQDASLSFASQVALEPVYKFFSSWSLLDLPLGFDPEAYRNLNPDLAAMSPSQVAAHYIQFGRKEGRLYKYCTPEDFSPRAYFEMNPDLAKLDGLASAAVHWTKFGAKEGRRYK